VLFEEVDCRSAAELEVGRVQGLCEAVVAFAVCVISQEYLDRQRVAGMLYGGVVSR
jgi:hypothetical protein